MTFVIRAAYAHNGGVAGDAEDDGTSAGPGRDDGPGLRRLRRYTWASLTATTSVFLFGVLASRLVRDRLWPTEIALAAVAVAMVCCAVAYDRRLRPGRPPPWLWLAAGNAASLALCAIGLAYGERTWFVIALALTVAATASFLSTRMRWILVAATMAATSIPGFAAGSGLHQTFMPSAIVLFSVWATLGMLWAWDVAVRLDSLRRVTGELAVARERLRFAADLHDVQGHHLQVIALKSELAERIAAASPERAAAEMAQVRELAATALAETRALVHGYRRTTLDAEIANASRVLAAAGIDVRTDVDPVALPEEARHLLGLVVREATTNVLRHSDAGTAELACAEADGEVRVRIANDGANPPSTVDGSGLRSLAERLEAAGGELTWTHRDGRFTVTAALPSAGAAGTSASRSSPAASPSTPPRPPADPPRPDGRKP